MKKTFLALVVLLQFIAVGCSQVDTVDAIEQDEAYLEQHNEMSAEETVDTIDNLKNEELEETSSVDPIEGGEFAVQSN